MLGDLADAAESFRSGAAIAETCNFTSWALCLANLALVHEHEGHRARAARVATEAKRVVVDLGLGTIPQLYLVHIVSAYFEALAGEGAESDADRARGIAHLDRCRAIGPWGQLQAHIVLANLGHVTGDARRAAMWLDGADEILLAIPDAVFVKNQIAEARIALTIPTSGRDARPPLSAAERRVLEYLPTHLGLAEIADKLYLSRHTVKSHVVSIYRKLGVSSRSEAVEVAQVSGLVSSAPTGIR